MTCESQNSEKNIPIENSLGSNHTLPRNNAIFMYTLIAQAVSFETFIIMGKCSPLDIVMIQVFYFKPVFTFMNVKHYFPFFVLVYVSKTPRLH